MRINEAMQVRLSPDCYCAEEWPAPVGAKDQEPRTRWAFPDSRGTKSSKIEPASGVKRITLKM